MKNWKLHVIFVLIILCALIFYRYVNGGTRKDLPQGDVYYSWVEGARLLQGENPYARILAGDMVKNDKYATYFPLFYLLSALSQVFGLREWESWITFWKIIFVLFDFAVAALIFYHLSNQKLLLLAVLGSFFWLLNRWSIYLVAVDYFDFIPIFFMVLSLLLFPRRIRLSLLALSLSLAIKQIAIFLVPLYLIWLWNISKDKRWQNVLEGVFWIGLIPLATSLPFLVWNAEGFIKSILFSVTREADSHVRQQVISEYTRWTGLVARMPLIYMLGLAYLVFARSWASKFVASFAIMIIFLEFNPVQFLQYFAWVMVFVPFVIGEVLKHDPGETKVLVNS